MSFTETTALHKILKMKSRVRVVQGGARAGKSIAILLILIDIAQSNKGKTISIVSETVPHLRRGVIRDFLAIMQAQGYFKESNWNRSNFIYQFETGSIIEFFSADSPDKVRGPARNILFINECNNVPYETYTQLSIRTSEYIYLDYNPVSEFWVHENVITKPNHDFEILTYKDNEGLPKTIVEELESRRENKAFWRIYGEGLIGESEANVFNGWKAIDEIPHEARLVKRGLDFGYTNDPSGLIDVYQYNGGFIFDEQLYQKGMSNKSIADAINSLPYPNTLIIADSSEPKSIDELRLYGINVLPANKGQGSVNQGIQFIQNQRISYTKRSTNLAKEYRNYMWLKDKLTDQYTNKPQDFDNHLLDPARYALESYFPRDDDEDNYTSGDTASTLY